MMEYLTLADTYRLNAQRHRDKAADWTALGRLDYAAGSLRKAAKWEAKAEQMCLPVDPFLDPIVARIVAALVKNIIEGDGR